MRLIEASPTGNEFLLIDVHSYLRCGIVHAGRARRIYVGQGGPATAPGLSTMMFAKAPVVVGQTFPARRFAHHWGGAVQTAWVTTTCNILSLLVSINVMTPRLEDTFGKGHYRKLIRLGRAGECATRAGLPSEADFDGSSCDVADGPDRS
jgi:hypothetical protein